MKRRRPQKYNADTDVMRPTTVQGLKTYFRCFDLDVRKKCSDTDFSEAMEGAGPLKRQHGCWLIMRASVWNRFFESIGIELRQNRPGKLSVFTFAPRSYPNLTKYGHVCATLLGELLEIHRCIDYVHCGYSGHLFALKPSMLDRLVPNAALEQFHLDGKRMARNEAYGLLKALARGQLATIQVSNLQLRKCDVTTLSNYVESAASLKELFLVNVGLKAADIVALFKALEPSNTVELKLEMNTVSIRGAQQFAKLLQQNKRLRSATVQSARLRDKAVMAIASALEQNSTLIALCFASNCIGPTGTRALADALKINNSLMVLDLQNNAMGDEGAYAVAEMLAVNTKLEELHVCGNGISDHGIVTIAESLLRNRTLKVLSLFDNEFRENGVAALAKVLVNNKTLQRVSAMMEYDYDSRPVDVFMNTIGFNTALRGVKLSLCYYLETEQLSHSLVLTKTLQSLSVCLYDRDIYALCIALETNQSIQEVEIDCSLSIEDGAALARLFEVTTTIRTVTIVKMVSPICLCRMFDGLVKNKSIWRLSAQSRSLNMIACTAIAAALEVNRTLCCMEFGRPSADEARLSVLSAGIENNPVIQTIELGYTASSSAGLKIRKRLRHNLYSMMQAIEFVLAHTVGKFGAEAFELFKGSGFFHRELGKAGASSGHPSTLALIREAERFVEDNYFRITGVVKEEVVCVQPHGKRSQQVAMFDNLNKYCLKEVLSHLRVSDVR